MKSNFLQFFRRESVGFLFGYIDWKKKLLLVQEISFKNRDTGSPHSRPVILQTISWHHFYLLGIARRRTFLRHIYKHYTKSTYAITFFFYLLLKRDVAMRLLFLVDAVVKNRVRRNKVCGFRTWRSKKNSGQFHFSFSLFIRFVYTEYKIRSLFRLRTIS